jgi:hypothetical protein
MNVWNCMGLKITHTHTHTYICVCVCVLCGNAFAQLVEALCYKSDGRGIDSRLKFFIYIILPAALGLTACDRNECQEYFPGGKYGRFVGLTTLPPSCAEIREPQPPGTLKACPGP